MIDYIMRYDGQHDFQTNLRFRNLNNHIHHKHTTNIVCKTKNIKKKQTNKWKNNTKQYFNRIVIKTDVTLNDIAFNINGDSYTKNDINVIRKPC